ncbi:pyridoxine/pyridoxamine 5'-phosphate oxidase [Sphingomicrobium sediminis]|uniref:Pyridoxal 5'-phosphate synthase n=1 Tax=Sphingomicrobium sediminis TaxID=2950949 RepID=A0A9X2EES8_9SPHN|nr:pyridoxal 5'-phosphate synthase [Sphingomicrobium sediminis]MCM8556663.1 pyridoxal 5'-phosphate synthase [Sphingomicrobium sediminis]
MSGLVRENMASRDSALLREELRDLSALKGPYAPFSVDKARNDPIDLFESWLRAAIKAGISEPHAMTLSTVDQDGGPDARIVILKDLDELGWHFASSKESAKGRQIAANDRAAMTFYWRELGRQVRIRGTIKRLGRDVSSRDFSARSRTSKALALIGKQSEILADWADLEVALEERLDSLDADPSIYAPQWAAYAMVASEIEFWQASSSRAHRRVRFIRSADRQSWRSELLWP